MKKSEYNLMVINNFILHYTHDSSEMNCDEMYQAAKDYIKEDHADGEESEDNNIFTTDDMRKSFVAGECFESESLGYELGDTGETNLLDFGDWMEKLYNVKID